MNSNHYPHALLEVESRLTENFIKIAEYYKSEPGIYYGCQEMASISNYHSSELNKIIETYKVETSGNTHNSLVTDHTTGTDLVKDLRFVWLLTMEALMLYSHFEQVASSRDELDLEMISCNFGRETEKQAEWLSYRINMAIRRFAVEA